MAVEDNEKTEVGRQPVHLGQWVEAKRPRLHPTRRKVLAGVADFSQGGAWTTSSEVRQEVDISQQLLNRHLRALEAEGLVRLDHPGPGLPLKVQATGAGLRALGLRGPQPLPPAERIEPPADSPPAPEALPAIAEPTREAEAVQPGGKTPALLYVSLDDLPAQPAPPPLERRPNIRLKRRSYEFLEGLCDCLAPFFKNLEREDFFHLAGPALDKRPVLGALYDALSPHLPGVGVGEFKEILASLFKPKAREPEAEPAKRPPGQAKPKDQEPPPLSPPEIALEEQLSRTMNQAYAGLAWHRRTRLMSDEWDRARRRRLGCFNTIFVNFGPRWQRRDWNDFNQARRQADHRGADYAQWVTVQFDRVTPEGNCEVRPSDLHGERAVAAYLEYRREDEGDRDRELGPPPYTAQSFNPHDAAHLEYAQRLIGETIALAERIMAGEPQGPARLLAQAVRSGALPQAALDLAPGQREAVLEILRRDAGQYMPLRPVAGPQPKVII
ncbi:hypothetical protein AAU61_03390 [Desulfocarbo indianensis]|nr:hypothetical protein AAU61_03390 [Desulfocarbo indianensis]